MSDNASWYQRKMAQAKAGVSGRPPSPTPVVPPLGRTQYPQQQQPVLNMFNVPVQQPQPQVTVENLWGAMQHWRGGKAHKVDAEPCPECGSPNFYSRTEGARRGPPPAPHCFACGYNGLFTQGLQATWQGGG